MKKLFLCLAAIAMFSSCSSDDSGSATAAFESNIQIDGVAFVPGTPNDALFSPIMTAFEAGVNNGESNYRLFTMSKTTGTSGDIASIESLQISVFYPTSQTSINGTYDFDFEDINDPYIQGGYMKGMTMETFSEGTMTITDLGNNNFKLVFNNVITSEESTITGSIEGTFEVQSGDF